MLTGAAALPASRCQCQAGSQGVGAWLARTLTGQAGSGRWEGEDTGGQLWPSILAGRSGSLCPSISSAQTTVPAARHSGQGTRSQGHSGETEPGKEGLPPGPEDMLRVAGRAGGSTPMDPAWQARRPCHACRLPGTHRRPRLPLQRGVLLPPPAHSALLLAQPGRGGGACRPQGLALRGLLPEQSPADSKAPPARDSHSGACRALHSSTSLQGRHGSQGRRRGRPTPALTRRELPGTAL